MAKKQWTSYSIKQNNDHRRNHSLAFYWNPIRHEYKKAYIDGSKLSHAKKTLAHCRKYWPTTKFEIVKRITIVEILDY